MTNMTQQQEKAFAEMCTMLKNSFKSSDEMSIRGALRLAMAEWERETGHTVAEAESWSFENISLNAMNRYFENLLIN